MKNLLDSHNIEIPCPHCSKKNSETIGRLKTKREITCRHCGASFDLDTSNLRREVAQVENQLAQLNRTLGKLGK